MGRDLKSTMPFKPIVAPKCPKCEHNVYAAEEKVAGGFKWHKVCFKCNMCNKMLDSTNCTEHEKALFCKTCYGRKYGPKGVGFGQGAGALSTDTGSKFENGTSTNGDSKKSPGLILAPEGEGCPRCGGYVYHADQVFGSKNVVYHKQCFLCNVCNKTLNARIACDGPDKEVYCNVCHRKKFGLKGYGFGQGGPALMSATEQESEESKLTSADVSRIQARDGEEGCPRCGGRVFHAEQKFSKNNVYHKRCFVCNACRRALDSMTANDGPDREIYCKLCYSKNFGATGYGFGGGAAFLKSQTNGDKEKKSSSNGTLHLDSDVSVIQAHGDCDRCPRCGGQVFHAEKKLSKNNVFHSKCFNCLECHKPLDSMTCNDGCDEEIYCTPCYSKKFGPKGYGYGGRPTLTADAREGSGRPDDKIQMDFLPGKSVGKAKRGCPRCMHPVYEAEKLMAAKRAWHRRCFVCCVCSRPLDSTTVNDGQDGRIYCRACYQGKFGLKGYGFGQGAGTPALTSDGYGEDTRIVLESAFILP